MSSDKSSDADRWRSQLEDAERELDDKTRDLEATATLLSSSFEQIVGIFDSSGKQFTDHLKKIELAVGTNINVAALRRSVSEFVNELSSLQPASEEPALTGQQSDAGSRVCALLISEILYQLLQSVSLPTELNEKIDLLKECLDKGVSSGSWGDMLERVADISNDIRLKINTERTDTESFLKQVTGRLQDMDQIIQGTEENRKAAFLRGQDLDVAVKEEMKGLQTSIDEAAEIGALKNAIQSRLEKIETHLSGFVNEEESRQGKDARLVETLVARLNELEEETTVLKERVRHERMQAQMDPLTGVANRLGYIERVNQEFARWKRFGNPLALVVCDIDFFKRINDNYGHVAGDKALKSIAKTLSGKIRETDFLARYGGEEFVMIMPGADTAAAKGVAEKLRSTVESLGFHFKGEPVSITISCGISEFKQGDTVEDVFERADKGLYEAKEGGRNRVVCKQA